MSWLKEWREDQAAHENEYNKFGVAIRTAGIGYCWACGADNGNKPRTWHGPWFMQRAHIVNKPRIKDRRVVLCLCPHCHFVFDDASAKSRITLANAIWLKWVHDPKFFDYDLMQNCSVKKLPNPDPNIDVEVARRFQHQRGLTRIPVTF